MNIVKGVFVHYHTMEIFLMAYDIVGDTSLYFIESDSKMTKEEVKQAICETKHKTIRNDVAYVSIGQFSVYEYEDGKITVHEN